MPSLTAGTGRTFTFTTNSCTYNSPVVTVEEMTSTQVQETLRMWSAVSFAVIILGLGLPLWWKTTEVHRVGLPLQEIEELQHADPRMALNLSVHTEYPSRTNRRMVQLKNALASSRLFDARLSPARLDVGQGSVAESEAAEEKSPSDPGSFKIIETPGLENGTVFLGNHRALYFHPDADTDLIVEVLRKWVLRESYLEDLVGSLERPGSRSGQERRLKSEPCFDIVFTTVNPEPDVVSVSFDAESSIENVIDPLLSQLKPVADLKVKSQWLYFVDIGVEPKKSPEREHYVVTSDKIPLIISPLEKKLGSGVSKCPCLHFVLYVPSCSHSPLYFGSPDGGWETAVVSPRWGGIQIHNPSKENCVNGTALEVDIATVTRVFVTHLRYLLDLRYPAVVGARMATLTGRRSLRGWEVDSLYRARVLDHAITARLTLHSLSRLLGEISNIVINEEVGDAIHASVAAIASTLRRLSLGHLPQAIASARTAYVTAETAFSHPSLLALLYFPDDQKYAVYIPLFLPVMIPVLLSLKHIFRWIRQVPADV